MKQAGSRRHWTAVLVLSLLLVPLFGMVSKRVLSAGIGVNTLTGSVTVTDPYILENFTEYYVGLSDLTAFVRRDFDMPLPGTTMIVTGLAGDWATGATYSLSLPIAPQGQLNDLAHGSSGDGVQIYSLDVQANVVGDPFLDGTEFQGWSSALTSLKVANDTSEVTGGQLVVWAPDAKQRFPNSFGDDGKLFTVDDPVAPVAAGWTVIDLDQQPFGQRRDERVEVPILEGDLALRDLSDVTFTEAFDAVVAELRQRYPFTEYKAIDWDAIVAEIRPSIAFAEQRYDVLAFNVAMMQFSLLLRDAHVLVTPPYQWIFREYGGGVGLDLGLTDDRRITVRCVSVGLPADEVGIEPAAEIISWNGEDPLTALAQAPEISSASTDHFRNLNRLFWMTWARPGKTIDITYRNPGSAESTSVQLTVAYHPEGVYEAPCGLETYDPSQMPVAVEVLPSGIGLISVNTFSDDAILMSHAWDWAIERLKNLDVPSVIVDVRGNGGGIGWLATYFAGSFTSVPYVLNESFTSNEAGERIAIGATEVEPSPEQWTKPVAVVIDAYCASACEIFAAAMAHDPDHLIVGRTPTAGAEGGVIPWVLPGGIDFQAPVVAFTNPDGSIFLEGVGVVPNVPVPNTPDSLVINPDVDYELDVAESALRGHGL